MSGDDTAAEPPLGIYVHWPFCASKCPYCDFNSHVRAEIDEERWGRAYRAAIGAAAARWPRRTVSSVFFGGGTPSLMAPETVATILAAIRAAWTVPAECEVSLEANPSSAERERFAELRAAGVNRLSIGVQSFSDPVLRFLGRVHDAAQARAAVDTAAQTMPRFSFDLIYAWPGQTVTRWRSEMRAALALAGEHLSAYQLTIEPGTGFHRRGVSTTDEETTCALFAALQEETAAAGLTAYEVSNHARASGECAHNLAVWRGGDYLGIGPGAHGRVAGERVVFAQAQPRRPERWLDAVERGDGVGRLTPLSTGERAIELILMGLRLTEGVCRAHFARQTGMYPEDAVAAAGLQLVLGEGLAVLDDQALRVTAAGRRCLDAVLRQLLT